ncbi:carbohydrate ABC transporter substrate-binding protein, CUT1 family [Micromonospora coriariae]|uniref:Carbohydrate ABC transporter substrate-binding protein, CUT1 family n=1 Tax=Micromonospora coriariae TaxID=285665 RepID=A0A1C4U2C2_9ACTN|nr:extracellular solute-binding protein [Micromonospora coriariae]SCE65794.1 carbohydrate ABC transporter substrate-binding protein, CUT1 family [Micromonospora coriariae]
MTASLSRRRFLAGAGLTALGITTPSLLLSGCSGDSGGGAGTGTGKVDLWLDIQGDANQKYFTDNVAAVFEKAKPKIDLNTTFYKGDDLRRLVQTALQSRSGPDIVRGPSATQTIAWSKAHVLADLTPYAEKFAWKDKLSSWAVEAFTTDGKLYALPMRVDTMLLYFNKTLFAQKGWQQPTDRASLEALATEAAGQGIVPFGSSNVDWKAAGEWLMTVFWNHYSGPDALRQALSGEIKFTDPVFVDAVALIKSYFDKGWIGGSVEKYFSVPSQEIGANFGKGKVAMVPQGNWFMSQVGQYFGAKAKNGNDWDWMPVPALRPEVKYPLFEMGIGGSLAINEASKNKDAAAEYLNWYYGDRTAALKRMSEVPSTYNVPIDFADGDIPSSIDPRAGRVLTSLNKAVADGQYGFVTWTWWPPKTDVFVYEGLEQVLTGKLTPAAYCKQLDQMFTEEKANGNLPQLPAKGPGK